MELPGISTREGYIVVMGDSPGWREKLPRYIIDLDRVAAIVALTSPKQADIIRVERDRAIDRLCRLLQEYPNAS